MRQPAKVAMAMAPPMPSVTPTRPPMSESVTASTRNWPRMCRRRAPTAMRRPISRVRSVTDTSMMFMMPMPPTSNQTHAIDANRAVVHQIGHRERRLLLSLEDLGRVPEPEVVVLERLEPVALAQEPADLVLGLA